ncbi:MAG: MoxR family ATPase [Acidobacteriota bacterium]|nr:MoxR family ATPase [Acidobacteriota bacterium]
MATVSEAEIPVQTAAVSRLLTRLEASVGSVIRGKEEAIRLSLVALLARGHLLIEDVPGVGKTTLARAIARSVGCTFQRIQFTSDMLPSDVLGVSVFNPQNRHFEFRPGPIFAQVVLADELNRTTPKTQSALLEAMNETQVTIDGQTHALPRPFMVIATQNPAGHHGAFPLPESQLDRFLLRVEIGYPAAESEIEILRGQALADPLDRIVPVMSAEELMQIQQAVRRVSVDESLLSYLTSIAGRTRSHSQLSLGVSPRGSLSLCRAAQAMALLDGRTYCIPDDFKTLAVPVFAHRCVASSQGGSPPQKSAEILREILSDVPVPL